MIGLCLVAAGCEQPSPTAEGAKSKPTANPTAAGGKPTPAHTDEVVHESPAETPAPPAPPGALGHVLVRSDKPFYSAASETAAVVVAGGDPKERPPGRVMKVLKEDGDFFEVEAVAAADKRHCVPDEWSPALLPGPVFLRKSDAQQVLTNVYTHASRTAPQSRSRPGPQPCPGRADSSPCWPVGSP